MSGEPGKCYRCNAPAEVHTWNVCAFPGVHPLCTPCDIALNALVLAFMGVPDAARRIRRYSKKLSATPHQHGAGNGGKGHE